MNPRIADSLPFRFSVDVPIRYADIDAQGHLNNAAYMTLMEHARVSYLAEVGLWSGYDFSAIGMILASVTCEYRSPAYLGETVTVWMRVCQMGNKSFRFDYRLVACDPERDSAGAPAREIARANTVQVCYDYSRQKSIAMPGEWRQTIAAYEPALETETTLTPCHHEYAPQHNTGSPLGPVQDEPFRFALSIPIRYADIDAQRHLNNVAYISFMEHAQVLYLSETGLWDGKSFGEIGMIVAKVSCSYKAPAYLGETVAVRARVSHLGVKSFHFDYRLETERTRGARGEASACEIARVESVQVCYDYARRQSVPVPDAWRRSITAYEPGLGGSGR